MTEIPELKTTDSRVQVDHQAQVHPGSHRQRRRRGRGELQVHLLRGPRPNALGRRAADHHQRERNAAARRCDEAGNPGMDAALQARPYRDQARLRPRRVRRLHRSDRRCAPLQLLHADPHCARTQSHDCRRTCVGRWASFIPCSRPWSTRRASNAPSACRASSCPRLDF